MSQLPHEAPDLPSWDRLRAQQAEAKPDDTARNYVRTFGSPAGQQALDDLRRRFLDREIGPEGSDAALRHHEGARSVVRHILNMIEVGSK